MKSFKKTPANGVPFLAWLLSLALLTGCATGPYTAFHGRQAWPTANAIPETEYAVPVYYDWPERPYRVLGTIQIAEKTNPVENKVIAQAAVTAKSKGGDALILRHPVKLEPRVMTEGANDSAAVSPARTSILVIQWKTLAEQEADRQATAAFWTRFHAKYPRVALTDEFKQLTVEYGAYQGLDLTSPKDSAGLAEELNGLSGTATNAASAKWLFRGAIHLSGFAASIDETLCGLATITQSGDNVTITFHSGEDSFNFTGLDQNERLSGDIEISAGPSVCKAKAAGVVLTNRVTLDSRAQNAEGTVRATFTFLHTGTGNGG
jgi:hypothetical protein